MDGYAHPKTPQSCNGKWLIHERIVGFQPTLAVRVGLNEAIVLQQLHYVLIANMEYRQNTHCRDGRYWASETFEEWLKKHFPFWSMSTLKRAFATLTSKGLLIGRRFDAGDWSQRCWHTIDYDRFDALMAEMDGQNGAGCGHAVDADVSADVSPETAFGGVNPPECQNDTLERVNPTDGSKRDSRGCQYDTLERSKMTRSSSNKIRKESGEEVGRVTAPPTDPDGGAVKPPTKRPPQRPPQPSHPDTQRTMHALQDVQGFTFPAREFARHAATVRDWLMEGYRSEELVEAFRRWREGRTSKRDNPFVFFASTMAALVADIRRDSQNGGMAISPTSADGLPPTQLERTRASHLRQIRETKLRMGLPLDPM